MKKDKSSKNLNPSIPRKKTTKPLVGDVNKKFGFYNNKELSKAKLDEFIEALIKWADNGEPKLFLNQFLREYKVSYQLFDYHLERSDKLKAAKEYAMQAIAHDRELRAYSENYWGTFRHTQGLYDQQWKSQEEHFNDLKQKAASNNNSNADVVVHLKNVDRFEKDIDEDKRRTEDTSK